MKKITIGQIASVVVLGVLAVGCLLPLLLVVIASFSSDKSLSQKGFSFIPMEWSTEGWEYVLDMGSQLALSYRNTIFITVFGTVTSLLIMSMLAYALAHPNFVFKKAYSWLLIGMMLFSGGQLSSYVINTGVYHLKDTMAILCMPIVSTMYVIIMRTYIQENISITLIEAAKIDGAGAFQIYRKIVLPLMRPALASVGFMVAILYWNNWETGYLYITTQSKLPLQTLLMRAEKKIEMLQNTQMSAQAMSTMWETVPAISARMAMLITVLGPIMIAYPFFQKHFVSGLTMGSVKG